MNFSQLCANISG